MAKFVIAVSSTTFEWTRKALTPGYTIQFTAGDTYLQFLIQVCFSPTLPELVFLVSVFLPLAEEIYFSRNLAR